MHAVLVAHSRAAWRARERAGRGKVRACFDSSVRERRVTQLLCDDELDVRLVRAGSCTRSAPRELRRSRSESTSKSERSEPALSRLAPKLARWGPFARSTAPRRQLERFQVALAALGTSADAPRARSSRSRSLLSLSLSPSTGAPSREPRARRCASDVLERRLLIIDIAAREKGKSERRREEVRCERVGSAGKEPSSLTCTRYSRRPETAGWASLDCAQDIESVERLKRAR